MSGVRVVVILNVYSYCLTTQISSFLYITRFFQLKNCTATYLKLNKCLKFLSLIWFHYLPITKGRNL